MAAAGKGQMEVLSRDTLSLWRNVVPTTGDEFKRQSSNRRQRGLCKHRCFLYWSSWLRLWDSFLEAPSPPANTVFFGKGWHAS